MTENGKQLSEVDLAHDVLCREGHAMYFRDLITQVLERKGQQVYFLAHAMAEVHTQINMDSRFMHMGKGMWGLNEWVPQRGGYVPAEAPATPSTEMDVRREKLLEEIQQQEFTAATGEAEENE
jgi:DNA-directed RNA polymerase subunit delta